MSCGFPSRVGSRFEVLSRGLRCCARCGVLSPGSLPTLRYSPVVLLRRTGSPFLGGPLPGATPSLVCGLRADLGRKLAGFSV